MTEIGANLSSDVRLGFNFVEVNSALRPGLNKSAIITFEGLSNNFANATILRNGQPCPSSICTALTGLNAGTVIINVTGWTNYSIGSGLPSAPTLDINEPDNNDVYTQNMFPVLFSVDLSQSGRAWFSLNNGSANTTMNTDDNESFTYSRSALPAGNYTFTAYANFTNTLLTDSAFVNFRVTNTTISGSPPQNNSQNNSNNNTPPIVPPNTSIILNNSNSNNLPGDSSPVQLKHVVYWLLVVVLCIAIIILIFLIVKYFQARGTRQNTIPGSIVSQLR